MGDEGKGEGDREGGREGERRGEGCYCITGEQLAQCELWCSELSVPNTSVRRMSSG